MLTPRECADYWAHCKETFDEFIEMVQNDALEEASRAVKEPYLQAGMTNLANRAYQSIQKLKKQ